jgi:diguanylate cyclase (GGDEF)-like protein/PAS domain S-box-containing protein
VDRSQLVVLADAMAALAFAAVALSILVPLSRTGRLTHNRLDLVAALVFVACSIGNVVQLAWGLSTDSYDQGTLQLAGANVVTALVAVTYVWMRRLNADPEDGGGFYEDARRRQHELAGQVMAANVREELASERAGAAEQRLNRVFTASTLGLAVIDRRGTITKANPALTGLLEGPPEHPALVGSALGDIVAPADRDAVEATIAGAGEGGHGIELHIRRSDGAVVVGRLSVTPLPDDDGSLLAQFEDLSDRRRVEDQLEHLMLHDVLTDLPNRVLFHTRATAALRQATRTGCYVGCVLIDLDGFKVVNDSLGHTAGDLLLTTMARRLTQVVRPGDTVARTGSDEFCLLLVGLEHQAEAEAVSQRVRDALDLIVDLDGVQVSTSGSVGVAVALPGGKTTSETLVRDADMALSRAKAQGKGQTVVFDAELREDVQRRLDMVTQTVAATT